VDTAGWRPLATLNTTTLPTLFAAVTSIVSFAPVRRWLWLSDGLSCSFDPLGENDFLANGHPPPVQITTTFPPIGSFEIVSC
jgi:hypothetical protein